MSSGSTQVNTFTGQDGFTRTVAVLFTAKKDNKLSPVLTTTLPTPKAAIPVIGAGNAASGVTGTYYETLYYSEDESGQHWVSVSVLYGTDEQSTTLNGKLVTEIIYTRVNYFSTRIPPTLSTSILKEIASSTTTTSSLKSSAKSLSQHTHSESLSTGAEAGIGLGIGISLFVALGLLLLCMRRRRRRASSATFGDKVNTTAHQVTASRRDFTESRFLPTWKNELSGEPQRTELDNGGGRYASELDARNARHASELDAVVEMDASELIAGDGAHRSQLNSGLSPAELHPSGSSPVERLDTAAGRTENTM